MYAHLNNCQKRRVLKRSDCREVITAYSSECIERLATTRNGYVKSVLLLFLHAFYSHGNYVISREPRYRMRNMTRLASRL